MSTAIIFYLPDSLLRQNGNNKGSQYTWLGNVAWIFGNLNLSGTTIWTKNNKQYFQVLNSANQTLGIIMKVIKMKQGTYRATV